MGYLQIHQILDIKYIQLFAHQSYLSKVVLKKRKEKKEKVDRF